MSKSRHRLGEARSVCVKSEELDEPGPERLSLFGHMNAALAARIKWPPLGPIPDAELNLGEVGITGGVNFDQLREESQASIPIGDL